MIKIVDRYDNSRVLHEVEAETLRDAVLKLVGSGANLSRADLSGAYLSQANLSGAYLSQADLSQANLSRADLSQANLSRADLSQANLSRADLSGAYLSQAYLSQAYLSQANLSRAYLSQANLSQANLAAIRADLHEVLSGAPFDVLGLLEALRAGKIDGSSYAGNCACLVGTLENVARARSCPVDLPHRSERPAERWFLALQPGHTPENHPVAKITENWISDWLTAWAKESPELYAKAAGEAKQREIARLEARLAELRG